ncbi:MAG: hypothetical protein OEX18_14305 [Candidatus Krumholzibacteria bacterium]|nr:hypothetical protein [Candidatus Krumholzibacteria bacterium]MDH4338442.1 hypothetical protein [Candidatus Krumholzibacteria bacterium]MDH5271073.1 hypothetical protein [Candidatus Krumholzibacteria bacterium]
MRLRTRMILLIAGPVMYAVSCSSPNAPAEQGSLVFRFEPSPQAALVAAGGVADVFDSVAVCVFRSGSPITAEVRQGAAIGVDPVEMQIGCIAEPNKRVSVELFASGVMLYYGVNEDVDVAAGKRTSVIVDAVPFFVPALTVTPGIVFDGASFNLSWPSTQGAQTYRVEASASPAFSTIEWSQSLAETLTTATLPPGSHYFRVAPETPYATGTFAGPEFRYVLGGSGGLVVTGLSAVGVIPGETFSIYGENLDFPDVQAAITAEPMEIVSASWGALTVRLPLAARSGYISVASSLGADTSSDPLIAQRLAYVSATGLLAGAYNEVLWENGDDIEWSGIVYVPLADLDTRDMSVFDVILVATDTGTDVSNWGGGRADRAEAITKSGATVLAIGDGGAAFMQIVSPPFSSATVRTINQTSCYAAAPAAPLFTSPHPVTGGGSQQWIDMCQNPERTVSFDISSLFKPAGVSLYATTGLLNDRWSLADAVVTNNSRSIRHTFWGIAADPRGFTSDGKDCLSNAVFQLYKERQSPAPSAPAR